MISFHRRMSNTADVGLSFAMKAHGQDSSLGGKPVALVRYRDSNAVGFTPPVAIYDRMDETNADAVRLDKNIKAYVSDPEGDFVRPWEAWLANWRRFYDKYRHAGAKISAAFRSDEVDREARQFHAQLESFYDSYSSQRTRAGTAVPAISGPAPVGETLQTGLGLPWWFWTAGGVVLVGAGYLLYRKYQEGRAKARFIHKHAPNLLERYIPGFGKEAYGYSQAGRDMDYAPFSNEPRDASPVSAEPMGLVEPSARMQHYLRDLEPDSNYGSSERSYAPYEEE